MVTVRVPRYRRAGFVVGRQPQERTVRLADVPLHDDARFRGAREGHPVGGRPLDVPDGICVALEVLHGRERHASAATRGRHPDIETPHHAVLAAGEQVRAPMRIDVQSIDLARILRHLHVLKPRAEPRKVVRKDLAVRACREDGGVAVPLDVLYRQLVGKRARAALRDGGLGGDGGAHVDAVGDGQAVDVDGLEDVAAAQDGGALVGRGIEAEDGHADGVGGILGDAGAVGGLDGGRARDADGGGAGGRLGRAVGCDAAQELAHYPVVTVVHGMPRRSRRAIGWRRPWDWVVN